MSEDKNEIYAGKLGGPPPCLPKTEGFSEMSMFPFPEDRGVVPLAFGHTASEPVPSWSARYENSSVTGLYLHIPYCKKKCAYCDFASYSTPDDALPAAYAAALAEQVREADALGLFEELRTAYIGGGTPTTAGESLIPLVSAVAHLAPLDELTVEANPESLAEAMPVSLTNAGATRISLGVQSAHDVELKALGRIHTAEQAISALERCVAAGLRTSADLMCAIPLQTSASWAESLKQVAETGVGHVSVYPLQVEEGTPFARAVDAGELELPSDDVEAERMEEAEEVLLAYGLTRYEVASYAVPGDESLHNQLYWTGEPYLGLGHAAASMLTREGYERLRKAVTSLPELPEQAFRVRLTCTTAPRQLIDAPALAAQAFDVEFLTEREAVAEDLMLGARLVEGLDPALIAYAHQILGADRVDACLSSLVTDGYLTRAFVPTSRGWLLGNELYGRLWDLRGE